MGFRGLGFRGFGLESRPPIIEGRFGFGILGVWCFAEALRFWAKDGASCHRLKAGIGDPVRIRTYFA